LDSQVVTVILRLIGLLTVFGVFCHLIVSVSLAIGVEPGENQRVAHQLDRAVTAYGIGVAGVALLGIVLYSAAPALAQHVTRKTTVIGRQ
jgi:hypothetical protein